MAMAGTDFSEDKNLRHTFLDGWKLYEELEKTHLSFSSVEFQKKVRDSMELFENSTKMVNELEMFSPNELIDEMPTEHVQYLLLPFFLAKLCIKLSDKDRMRVLQLAEVYYNDFIQRCADYGLTDAPKVNNSTEIKNSNGPENELASLMRAAHSRNDKIAQFRKKKELDESINLMREAVHNETVDEEIRRDFFLKLLERNIIESREELDSLQLEKQMVVIRGTKSSSSGPTRPNKVQTQPRPPMKPFIITRDNTQKAVFGRGYPSLPVMTVGEFYHQRVHEGIFPNEDQVEEMNKQMVDRMINSNDKEEEENETNESLAENDDPAYLERQRAMDEYKDVVRRGDGNRHNRS